LPFTKTTRVWWPTTAPGAGTANLLDAEVNSTAANDNASGTVGLESGKMVVCARSGFEVPFSETVIDPISGSRVWAKFADQVPEPVQDDITIPSDGIFESENG